MAESDDGLLLKLAETSARHDERITSLFRLLDEREKQVNTAQSASERAGDKAEAAQRRINENQNEFRQALKDAQLIAADESSKRSLTFARKEEVERLVDRVKALELGASAIGGRSGGLGSAGDFAFKIVPLLLSAGAALAVFLKD